MIQKLDAESRRLSAPPYHRPQEPWVEVVVAADDDSPQTVAIRRRSLRQRRKLFTWSVTALTLGVILILSTSPYRMELLAPGPLSSPHAQLLNEQGRIVAQPVTRQPMNQSLAGFREPFGEREGIRPPNLNCA